MIALNIQEVFAALCEAFEISHERGPNQKTLEDLTEDEQAEMAVITARLNNKLAVKQSGSA